MAMAPIHNPNEKLTAASDPLDSLVDCCFFLPLVQKKEKSHEQHFVYGEKENLFLIFLKKSKEKDRRRKEIKHQPDLF